MQLIRHRICIIVSQYETRINTISQINSSFVAYSFDKDEKTIMNEEKRKSNYLISEETNAFNNKTRRLIKIVFEFLASFIPFFFARILMRNCIWIIDPFLCKFSLSFFIRLINYEIAIKSRMISRLETFLSCLFFKRAASFFLFKNAFWRAKKSN